MGTMEGQTALGEMKGFGARFAGMFMSPGETFAEIVRKPDIWAPLIVLIAGSVALFETMLAKVGAEQIVRKSLEDSGRAASMTPDQMSQALGQGAKFTAIVMHVSGLVGQPIFMLIVAGLGILFVNAFFGGKMNFKTSFSVACYGALVGILADLIGLAVLFFGDLDNYNPQRPIPSNLAYFLNPQTSSKVMMALGGSLDIFFFWPMALWGIGYAAASDRKAKPMSVFLCFFGIWVVVLLIKMGFAAIG